MRLLNSAKRTLQHPFGLMLLSTVVLTVVFGLGAVEQRKILLAESAEERVATHLSLASTLHYRNEADIAEALLPAFETKP
ncbi:MAG: hypothetical protein P8M13_04820, partial [Luminiphilus sp.]|nr:hypothetical protein [Luminiphilus sp.]